MAIVARISGKSGKLLKTVALLKGATAIQINPDAVVTIVDEATGRAVDHAHLVRANGQVIVNLPQELVGGISGDTLALMAEAQPAGGGAGSGSSPGQGSGQGNGLLMGGLGLLGLGGLVAALAGGGGNGNGNGGGGGNTDTTAPAAPSALALDPADDSGSSTTDRITNRTSALTISGTAEAGSTVTVLDGSTTLGTATADAGGRFTLDVALAQGAHSITATAKDAAGNTSPASAALAITVDTTAPVAPAALALAAADDSGRLATDGVTNLTSGLTITGTAEAGAAVTIKDGATTVGTGTAGANGQFSIDVALAAGVHSLTATATDLAGNTGTASAALAITVDTTLPPIPTGLALDPADDTGNLPDQITSQTAGLTISGTAEANSTVTIRDGATTVGAATANGSGAFSIDVALAEGAHSLTATATDIAGNTGAASTPLAIKVDTTAPTLAITSSLETVALGETATITFTFSEEVEQFDSAMVVVSRGEEIAGTITDLVQTSNPAVWTATFTPTASSSGPITISVDPGLVNDIAGNVSTAGGSTTVAYDLGTAGVATDGYIAGALVFRDGSNGFAENSQWDHEAFTDSNGNGLRDADEGYVDANGDGAFTAEYWRVTDAQGNFSNLAGSGRIVMTGLPGAVDISTGLAFSGTYSAPDGSTVVTPLTTVMDALISSGKTADEAEALVMASFGINSGSGIDLRTFDPLVAASSPETAALAVEVMKAAVQVANVLAVVASAATAAGATDGGTAASAATAAAIADQVSGGDPVNLGDSATMALVVQSVATATGGTIADALNEQSDALSSSLANVNDAVQQATGDSVTDILTAVVTAQIVAQETLVGDISGGTLDSTEYSGTSLTDKIDDAATQVETIIPAAPTTSPLGDPDRPTVLAIVGTRISGAEAAAGIDVGVAYGPADNVAEGDTLNLLIGGTVVKSFVLGAGDIPTIGTVTHTFTLSAADLGSDGGKAVTAQFVAASDGAAGPQSLPLLLTVDTQTSTPVVNGVEDGYINAADVAAGVPFSLGNIEVGSTITYSVSGDSATVPGETVTVTYNGTSKDFSFSAADFAQIKDGTVTISALQVDATGNVSALGTRTVTLDRAIGTPAGLDLAAANDTGLSNTDNTTAQASGLTITGTADAGSTVTFRDGATVLGSTTANGAGAFAIDIALADGVHASTADAVDLAGNVSPASAALTITVDGTAPAAPGPLSLSAADDTGALDSDGITSLTSGLAITGVAEANATIALRDGSTVIATGTADGSGNFSIDVTLAPGTHSLTAVAIDAAGNTSAVSAARTIIVDTTAVAPTGLALAAADDTGPQNNDGRTSQTSGLTITGVAEAFATVVIKEGATTLGTGTADSAGNFAIDVALAEGAHSLTAQFTDPAGNASPASAPLAIVVDATAPAAPAAVNAQEGPLVTISEAADGTRISGTTEAGSSVLVTLTGTASSFARLATVSGTSFTLDLSKADLDALGEGAISYTAAATDVAGSTGGASLTGQFLYTIHPVVDPNTALDDLTTLHRFGEGENVGVTPLAGGGFATHWLVDSNLDGDTDSIAVQRFDADGAALGGPVMLSGLSALLGSPSTDVGSFGLTALSGGGYALAYAVEPAEYERFFQLGTVNGVTLTSTQLVGVPQEIFVGNAPAGVGFTLSGTGTGGTVISVTLTPVNGVIAITQTILDQFSIDDRFSLSATGVPANTSFPVTVISHAATFMDPAAGLTVTNGSVTATLPNVSVGLPGGRNEVFQLAAGSPTPTTARMTVFLENGQAYDLSGLTNVFQLANGGITFELAVNPAGTYAVPQSLLDQLGTHDAAVFLTLGGIPINTTLDFSVSQRIGTVIPEGVYVQTFDAAGAATSDGTLRLDTSASPHAWGPDSNVDVTAKAGGGYVVRWTVDANNDNTGETIALQSLAANGTPQGAPVVLSGISPLLTGGSGNIGSVDVQQLESGQNVLAWSMTLDRLEQNHTVTAAANTPTPTLTIVGRPVDIVVLSAPAGVTYTITGIAPDGSSVLIPVTAVAGHIAITPEMMAQFQPLSPVTLTVTGLTTTVGAATSSASFHVSLLDTATTDLGGALQSANVSGTVQSLNGSPNANAIIFGPPNLRGETFHVVASGTPVARVLTIIPEHGTAGLDTTLGLMPGVIAVTVTSSSITLIMANSASGDYAVPQHLLNQLGDQNVRTAFILVGMPVGSTYSATITGHEVVANPEGVFVQTFAADGTAIADASPRLDDSASLVSSGDDSIVGITPLADGGFVVRWVVDGDHNGEGDGLAVQRHDASGAPQGDLVVLQSLPDAVNTENLGSYDLQALENGGYALSYSLDFPAFSKVVSAVNGLNGTATFTLSGAPAGMVVTQGQVGATYTLVGLDGAGNTVQVAMTIDAEGRLSVDAVDLAAFDNVDRLALIVGNLVPGTQTINPATGVPQLVGPTTMITLETVQVARVDTAAPSRTETLFGSLVPGSVGQSGAGSSVGTLVGTGGRIESFHLDQVTYASTNHSFLLMIATARDPSTYDLTGITGAFRGTNGTISVLVTPDANDNIAVPASLLAQMGSEDANITLVALNLAAGSTFAGTAVVRDLVDIPQGVFVQTYDASGAPLSTDLAFTGTAGADLLQGANGNDTLTSGGGADVVTGSAGDDTLVLSGPVDAGTVLNGGADQDTILLSAASASFVTASGSFVPLFNASITGVETIDFGTTASTSRSAIVNPGQLADGITFRGGAGTDTMIISTGLTGGTYAAPSFQLQNWNGGDSVVFSAGGAAGNTASFTLNAGVHDGALIMVGNSGNDVLNGTDGVEVMIGGAGNDELDGGAGRDNLTGGAGNDVFVLESPAGQTLTLADVINDFTVGSDHLQLSGGLTFNDLTITAVAAGTNGPSPEAIVATSSGDILARLINADAAQITAASFV